MTEGYPDTNLVSPWKSPIHTTHQASLSGNVDSVTLSFLKLQSFPKHHSGNLPHTHTHQFPKCIKELCSMFMQPSALLTQQKLKCELKVPWQWSRCAIENALMIDLWWQLLREDPNYFSFRDGWLWGRDFCCKTSHCKCA